ncbi:MAG: rhomboid family intramembrane serine protease [Gammaproteobacteria bacterium]
MPAPRDDFTAVRRDVLRYLRLIGAVIAALWLIEILDWVVFRGSLDTFGLEPRARRGLPGVVLHPLLHIGAAHLTANSVSFAIFGFMVLLRDQRDFWNVSALAWLVGGVGTWLVGHAGNHIGASGVIFGYFGYLLLTGWFDRRFGATLLSVVVLLLWGHVLFGLLPFQRGMSWELHVFGFIGGVLGAWLRGRRRRGSD